MVVFAILCAFPSYAQEIVWASKVISHTSQAGQVRFSANMALGKPNATADSTGNGWQPNGTGKEETIVVGFNAPIHAQKVLIVESMNTGYIRRVALISTDGDEYDVATFPARPGTKNARLVQINVADFNINVAAVKVALIPIRNVPTTIDAIGITTSTLPFTLTKSHEVIATK